MSVHLREKFISTQPRDNFYQTSAFIPMSFALVTTVTEDGITGIGPHALVYPFGIAEEHSMLLISRGSSGTAQNLRKRKRCALNYIEFNKVDLKNVSLLGYPGQRPDEKEKESNFTLIDSPALENSKDLEFPKIIQEAFQIFECTWDESIQFSVKRKGDQDNTDGHFVLRIDDILLKESFYDELEEGQGFPKMPIFYGFRNGTAFWFAEHKKPFAIPIPKDKGTSIQTVFYLANRMHNEIRFTEDACNKLVGIPRPFLKTALGGIVAEAEKRNAVIVDARLLDEINAERET